MHTNDWIGSKFFKTIITSTENIYMYLCVILKLKKEIYKLLTSLILRRVWYHLTFIPFIGQYTGPYISGSPKALLRRQIHQLISSGRFMKTISFPSLHICLVNFTELSVLKTFTCLFNSWQDLQEWKGWPL